VSGQLHALVTLYLGKEHPGPNVQEGRWAPELVWTPWWGEKFQWTKINHAVSFHGHINQSSQTSSDMSINYIERIVLLDFIHPLVSQEQTKLRN
jgi:hypothetical protein